MKVAASIVLILLGVPSWSTEPLRPLWGSAPTLTATPVALDSSYPARRQVGALTFLGGWHLQSSDPAFGGISSMQVDAGRFTLLSDYGLFTRFRFDAGRVHAVRFGALPIVFRTGWARPDTDSESMTRRGLHVWVGFENMNAIARLSPDLKRLERVVRPRPMLRWDVNGGPEAMVAMPDGAFLVFSETSHWPKTHGLAALWVNRDPTDPKASGFRFAYLPPQGYNPSDAIRLPDGRLLVLNRSFHLPFVFSAKLTVIDPAQIRPNALVRGQEIATLAKPLIHDNFEALAATREGADTIIWIASDDNQLALERTLLLKFRLEPQAGKTHK